MAKTSKRLAQHRKSEPAGLCIRTARRLSLRRRPSLLGPVTRRGSFFGRVRPPAAPPFRSREVPQP
jgi:hypothetical protein